MNPKDFFAPSHGIDKWASAESEPDPELAGALRSGAGPEHTLHESRIYEEPHVIAGMSEEEVAATVRELIVKHPTKAALKNAIQGRIAKSALEQHRGRVVAELREVGLLGRFYLAASDYPDCREGSEPTREIGRIAHSARYVTSKKDCENCAQRRALPDGSAHCAVFEKQLVPSVEYTEEDAARVEKAEERSGKAVAANRNASPKERIKSAHLSPTRVKGDNNPGAPAGHVPPPSLSDEEVRQGIISAKNLVRNKRDSQASRLKNAGGQAIRRFVQQELLRGAYPSELKRSMRARFSEKHLRDTQDQWGPVAKEAGVYGVAYASEDAFEDCKAGAQAVAHSPYKPKQVLEGSRCGSCSFNRRGSCSVYGSPLISDPAQSATPAVARRVASNLRASELLPDGFKLETDSPREALISLNQAADRTRSAAGQSGAPAPEQPVRMREHHSARASTPKASDESDAHMGVVRSALELLNQGKHGSELRRSLLARHSKDALVGARTHIATALKEQGLQGRYFIDPLAYEDYGKGCEVASMQFLGSAVPYVKERDRCAGCAHQTVAGHCSKLGKPLVIEPPYRDKAALQKRILTPEKAPQEKTGTELFAEFGIERRPVVLDDAPPEPETGPLSIGDNVYK
jgi:hypothetical protein